MLETRAMSSEVQRSHHVTKLNRRHLEHQSQMNLFPFRKKKSLMLPQLRYLAYSSLTILIVALILAQIAPKSLPFPSLDQGPLILQHMHQRLARATAIRIPTFFRNPVYTTPRVRLQTTMSSNTASESESGDAKAAPQLGLPAPGDGPTHNLDMSSGSGSVTMDHLGPMVVNVDGTLSRISNWDQMSEIEKKNTLRVLGKRNKQRLEALKKKESEGEQV